MTLSPQALKQKYAPTWVLSKLREEFAKSALALLGVDVVCVGHGTGKSKLLPGFHKDEFERFDFLCPEHDIHFEVTGTGWREIDSAERYDPNWKEEGRRKPSLKKAVLGVLKCKVDDAYIQGIQDRFFFVSINDGDGSWRFIPCTAVNIFPLGHFARSENLFYLIPWGKWRTPDSIKKKLEVLK